MSGSSISISISISGRPQVRRFDRLRVKFSPTLPAAPPAPPAPQTPQTPQIPHPTRLTYDRLAPTAPHARTTPSSRAVTRDACRRAHDTTLGPPRPTATAGTAAREGRATQTRAARTTGSTARLSPRTRVANDRRSCMRGTIQRDFRRPFVTDPTDLLS